MGFFFFFVTQRFLWRGLTNKWTWLCIIGGQLDSPPGRNIRKESCRLCEIWNKQSSSISIGAHRCYQALPLEGTDMLVRNVGWKREGLPSTDWPGTGGRSSLAFVLPVPTEKWKSYFPNKVRTGPESRRETVQWYLKLCIIRILLYFPFASKLKSMRPGSCLSALSWAGCRALSKRAQLPEHPLQKNSLSTYGLSDLSWHLPEVVILLVLNRLLKHKELFLNRSPHVHRGQG